MHNHYSQTSLLFVLRGNSMKHTRKRNIKCRLHFIKGTLILCLSYLRVLCLCIVSSEHDMCKGLHFPYMCREGYHTSITITITEKSFNQCTHLARKLVSEVLHDENALQPMLIITLHVGNTLVLQDKLSNVWFLIIMQKCMLITAHN